MKRSFWKELLSADSLIDEAKADALRMLDAGLEMFNLVLYVLHEGGDKDTRRQIALMDKALNNLQREVRKKVFEHLVLSRGRDLLTGLQLTSIVIDLERIGDYTKNMAELIDLFPDGMDWSPFEEKYEQVRTYTLEQFENTRKALADQDEEEARVVTKNYDKVSKTCDSVLSGSFEADEDDKIEKRFLGLVLIMRYFKRVNAHLKNTATSVINPFHEIGFRPGAV
jgi:phosphate uptake regulator